MENLNKDLTVWQRISKAFGPNSLLGQDIPTYRFDKKELLKTKDKNEYEKELLQSQQSLYLANQWQKIESNLYTQAIYYEPTRLAAFYDYESMEFTPEISTALDIYAEESTTPNENGYLLQIYSESKRIKGILADLFNNTLDINTNGTVVNERLKNITKEFKTVKFHISIEGTGKLYEYIRGGDSFDIIQLEQNIENFFNKLTNTTLIYTVTVQVYNIFDLVNIWQWYLKNRKPHDEIYFRNIVANPRYLNIHVLPQKYKLQAYEILKNANLPIGDYFPPGEPLGQGDIGFGDLISNLANSKHYTEDQQQTYLKEFLWFTKELDSIRNTNIKNVVPQLTELFEETYETV